MKNARCRIVLALLSLFLACGCLELTGQRISLYYEAESDRLFVLLCHDGIHEDARKRNPTGAKQIPEYVEGGDVMFVDWWARIDRGGLQEELEGDALTTAQRELAARYLASVKSLSIGHYRDPEGRLGAAQLIVIEEASLFVRGVNGLINEAIVAARGQETDFGDVMPRTLVRMDAEARNDRQWISFDGQSIAATFVVDRPEWIRAKVALLDEVVETVESDESGDRSDYLVQLLSSGGMSVAELGDTVTLRLGEPGPSNTARFLLRDRYTAELERAVIESVPASLDQSIAARLLGSAPPAGDASVPSTTLDMLLPLLPPEDRVRAVLGAGEAVDAARRAWLQSFAADWNERVGVPEAPIADPGDVEAWKEWYRQMLTFPVERESR